MIHCKKCSYVQSPSLRARQLLQANRFFEIYFWCPCKPTVDVDLLIQIVYTSALRQRRTVSSIFVILKIEYWFVTLQAIRDTASPKKGGGRGGGGGGGGGGAVLACNPPSPSPGIEGSILVHKKWCVCDNIFHSFWPEKFFFCFVF